MHNARVRHFTLLALILIAACRGETPSSSSKPASPPPAPKALARSSVVVIGIDGADWYVIRQLVRDGLAPNFARLMANGAWGDLQTMAPTVSPAIWTTMVTGYSPERHGIKEFVSEVPGAGTMTLVGSTERREAAVWNLATDAKVSVGVVNWWATFPAETVDGFLVSDRANLRRRFAYQSVLQLNDEELRKVGSGETYPADLLPSILHVIGANSDVPPVGKKLLIDPMPPAMQEEINGHKTLVRDKRLSVLKFVALQDHASATAARVAMEKVGVPKLLMVYFSGVDAVEHQFWAYYEPHRYPVPPPADEVKGLTHVIPSYYQYTDSLMGDLLSRVPSDALVIVVSDHGHSANMGWDPKAPIGEYAKWTMGSHGNAPPGIILFSGPGVQPGQLRRTSIYDIAPTLLALIGVPPSRDMPGRVITEAFTTEARSTLSRDRVDRKFHPGAAPHPTAAPVDPELIEKLRALGYIR
jgi:predicted AlkP superfamily pyrophosphatase or phosphodiesterase